MGEKSQYINWPIWNLEHNVVNELAFVTRSSTTAISLQSIGRRSSVPTLTNSSYPILWTHTQHTICSAINGWNEKRSYLSSSSGYLCVWKWMAISIACAQHIGEEIFNVRVVLFGAHSIHFTFRPCFLPACIINNKYDSVFWQCLLPSVVESKFDSICTINMYTIHWYSALFARCRVQTVIQRTHFHAWHFQNVSWIFDISSQRKEPHDWICLHNKNERLWQWSFFFCKHFRISWAHICTIILYIPSTFHFTLSFFLQSLFTEHLNEIIGT